MVSLLHRATINNNNNNVTVYVAVVIVNMACTGRVHPVHLTNAQCRRHAASDRQTKPNDLRCEFCRRLLPSKSTVAIYYYYSARNLILILSSDGGWKAESA